MGSGKLLLEAIKKYGEENFERETIKEFEDREIAVSLEKKLVSREFVQREDTYNILVGGGGTYQRNIEQKRKVSAAMKKYFANGGINFMLGRKHTEEARKKMSGHTHQKGKKNSQYGTCWIYNLKLKVNKKIKKEELKKYIEQGWIKGRKIKFN